jgi:pyruvate,water dikinase
VRLVFMAIGRKLVEDGLFVQPDDVFFLKYEELRLIAANHEAYDSKQLIKDRRRAREDAFKVRPRSWVGTITEWSLHGEPYKTNWGWPDVYTKADEMAAQPAGTIKGLGASAGVIEGTARIVHTPDEFDQVKNGEIVVCTMTNPAWVVIFTKIAGLVTDAGGALSHPAVVSREFGIPAVVGTGIATQRIHNGQRIRVNGAAGIVELMEG